MRRWSGWWLAALALALATTACRDDEARQGVADAKAEVEAIRNYIGAKAADGSYSGLLSWLNNLQMSVCGIDMSIASHPGPRWCLPTGDPGGQPPPPPPWGGE
jgi:hypothetical protein